MALTTVPLNPYFGSEIQELDLSTSLDDGVLKELTDLVYEKNVLVLRQQQLSPEGLVNFSSNFGELTQNVISHFLAGDRPAREELPPEILVISNIFEDGQPIGLYDGDATEWHADGAYKATPSSIVVLYCLEAANEGGDTLFAATEAAYDSLAPDMKRRIDGLQAVHSLVHMTEQEQRLNPYKPDLTEDQKRESPDVVHPLVRTHPVTGRKSLLLGNMGIKEIVGVPQSEADALVAELLDHATQAEYLYRHKWQVGDVVCWDNRSLIHTITECDREKNRRLLYRTSVRE